MMRAVLRWYRQVAPPWWTIVCFAVLYALIGSLRLLLQHWDAELEQLKVRQTRDAIVISAVCAYAVYRVVAFHPAFQRDYYEWLRLTPWRLGLPLPMGPVQLVPQDVVWILLALGAVHDATMAVRIGVLVALLSSYAGAICWGLWITGQRRSAYLIAAGLALVAGMAWLDARLSLLAAGIVAVVAVAALHASWRHFPWESTERQLEDTSVPFCAVGLTPRKRDRTAGWPFAQLSPRASSRLSGSASPLRQADRAMLCLLAGWWTLAAVWGAPTRSVAPVGQLLLTFVGGILVIERLVRYFSGMQPPISLLGRLATGRWLVPSFDRALIVPLLIILISFASFWLLPYERLVLPAAVTLISMLGQLGGPNLQTWRLTCAARLEPALDRREFERL